MEIHKIITVLQLRFGSSSANGILELLNFGQICSSIDNFEN